LFREKFMRNWNRWILASAVTAAFSMPALAADGDATQSVEHNQTIIDRNPVMSPTPLTSPTATVPGRLRPRDYVTPEDMSRNMAPADASRWTGHPDTESAPPLTGSEEQPGNMGPNSSKSQ
jgi:hypothetical protein